MKYELSVDKKLQYVQYDGHLYKVQKVVRFPGEKHKCCDGLFKTLEFRWYIKYRRKLYAVCFCNKCKTLFMQLQKK